MKNLSSIIKNFFKKEVARAEEIPEPTFEVIKSTDEELAENSYKTMKLIMWMGTNFDNIFEVAPKNADYAVGVLEKINGKEIPVIHYFSNKYTKRSIFEPVIKIFRTTAPKGALDFEIEQLERGNMVLHCIYRHDREVEFMFYAA